MQRSVFTSHSIGAGFSIMALVAASVVFRPSIAKGAGDMLQAFGFANCAKATACDGGKNNSTGPGVQGTAKSGSGVIASSTDNNGVSSSTAHNSKTSGVGKSGVVGIDSSADGGVLNSGVSGMSSNGTGVTGQSTYNYGVH